MCHYEYNPELSKDTNAVMKRLQCMEIRRQIGHCIVYDKNGNCNVPGITKSAK